MFIKTICKNKGTELPKSIGDMTVIALFLVMRSCEYSKVPQSDDRKTKIIKLVNIQFYMNGIYLDHSSERLAQENFVSIKFVEQKNDERIETVTQFNTNNRVICPIQAAAAIVSRLRASPSTNDSTPINTYINQSVNQAHITSKQIKDAI